MNKKKSFILVLVLILVSCTENNPVSSIDPVNWGKRKAETITKDSLISGKTYLSIYSQIYNLSEHKTHNLTATVSMRNVNPEDTIFVRSAKYFNSEGKLIRTYFEHPIYISPMETVEIVIDETDQAGGTGANFLFTWQIKEKSNEPLFEGIMISTSGQQGLSFTTSGIKLK